MFISKRENSLKNVLHSTKRKKNTKGFVSFGTLKPKKEEKPIIEEKPSEPIVKNEEPVAKKKKAEKNKEEENTQNYGSDEFQQDKQG